MITLVTSGPLAAIGRRDPHHLEVAQILDADPSPCSIPVAAIVDMAYMIKTDFSLAVEQAFLPHSFGNEWLRF